MSHMPVRAISLTELPKATRNRNSPIKQTDEWRETLRRIASSDFEALMVEFSPKTLALGKATPDRFRRLLATQIKSSPLAPVLQLTFRGKSATGAPILYVVRSDKMASSPKHLVLPKPQTSPAKKRKAKKAA